MSVFSLLIGIPLTFYVVYRLYRYLFPVPDIVPNGKYVLITGCGSGFGYALALELDKQGFYVLAGVRNPNAIEHLTHQLSSRATVFCLDITRSEDIDATYDLVIKKTKTLHALVNNAGIIKGGFIDWIPLDSIRETMEVNFFGHVALTKKFLPLLIARRGSRVVNMISTGGFLAVPGMFAYAASKFAFEAFSDCLRREMYSWGLHVSIIEPSFMKTLIIERYEHQCDNSFENLSQDIRNRWGENFFHEYATKIKNEPFKSYAENPNKAVKAMVHAIMSNEPYTRYRPGWQASLLIFPLSMLPAWMLDYLIRKVISLEVLPAGIQEQQN